MKTADITAKLNKISNSNLISDLFHIIYSNLLHIKTLITNDNGYLVDESDRIYHDLIQLEEDILNND